MKSLVVRLSLTIFAFAIAVFPARAEEWSKTYNISGKPDLRVETSDANIRGEVARDFQRDAAVARFQPPVSG